MSDVPSSPKLLRLDAEIKAERDRCKRGCLKAERAGFLGRQGFFEPAREGLANLQREFASAPDAKVSIWIQISESWIAHYNNQPAVARDRMRRAYALSAATGISDVQALSAAWLAHFAAHTNDFRQMANWMKIAIATVPANFHPAQTRICLVIALAYHFARRIDLAVPWYTKCREHAFADGDDGSISAMSFNRAGLHTNHALQSAIFGGDIEQYVRAAQTATSTTYSFDQLVRTASLSNWIYMVQAMMYSASGDYREARKLYIENLDAACDEGLQHQRSSFLADRAWCSLKLGDKSSAAVDAEDAEKLLPDSLYTEDKAVACGRLWQVYAGLGDSKADGYKQLAEKYWQDHETMREDLLQLLAELNLPDMA